ncbi:MAG: S9 family peptidase [Rhodanobacteraceae bacterium]|jgi:dipeptidyl aminopeptidase/acylaminoacyl peptidase|nr:MAG: S9 family peptidase [Rhodanobacteraceae bacterium]
MRWFAVALVFVFAPLFAAVPSPERALTDPTLIRSAGNSAAHPVPIHDLFFTHGVAGAAWSPDGREVVISTNTTGRFNLWKVPAAGGTPVQLTRSDDRQYGSTWSPDGKRIVYESDQGGNEQFRLYAVPANGGKPVELTPEPDVSNTGALFSPNGQRLAFNIKPKSASVTDIALLDWKTHAIHQLTHEASKDHLWQVVAWSHDGRSVYANRINAGFTDSSVWQINVATGKTTELTPHQGQVLITASAVSPDGRWLAVASNAKGGTNRAALYDISKHDYRWLTMDPWESMTGSFSPDGNRVLYVVNADGRSDIYLYDIASKRSQKLALADGLNAPSGNPTSFSRDGSRLLVSHQSSSEPADYWIYPVASGSPRQLTHSALPSIKPDALPHSQLVHYKSFDGTVISAFLWMPANLKRDGSAPGVVLPHGGPTGQTVDSFNRTALALASRGYVAIAPNVRGSTGYGLAFQKANIKDLGGGDLQDEVYAAKFLAATGYVNPKKIGITGGSYGGYMTLMAIGKTPDVWAAAVEEYGIINWITMLQHEDPFLRQYEMSLLGDPVKDRKIYDADSPITYIKDAKAPLLVLQGANDIRVPKEEAEQVVSILKGAGRTVDAHYYPNEGHGFTKRENQIDALQRTVAWFDRYLKGEAPSNKASH